MKTWLIEVNASPSLSAMTKDDKTLRNRVIHDTLAVAVPPPLMREGAYGMNRERCWRNRISLLVTRRRRLTHAVRPQKR